VGIASGEVVTTDVERAVRAALGIPKSDPVSLDTVSTTMTAAEEAGHARQATEVPDSWQRTSAGAH
jgi:hypothetical protein